MNPPRDDGTYVVEFGRSKGISDGMFFVLMMLLFIAILTVIHMMR